MLAPDRARAQFKPLAGFKQEKAEVRFRKITLVMVWKKTVKKKSKERKY